MDTARNYIQKPLHNQYSNAEDKCNNQLTKNKIKK